MTVRYEQDFYSWLMANAELLRQKRFSDIDAEHLAEELESMGRREKRELVSRLSVLLAHLLKWQFQNARRSRSWRNTLTIQRSDIQDLLADSPGLQNEFAQSIARAYEKAKLAAEDETGIDRNTFPTACPFSIEQILSRDFYPE